MKPKSKFKGVSWNSYRQKWRAKLSHKNVNYHLGYFETETEAVKARDLRIMLLDLDVPLQKFVKI